MKDKWVEFLQRKWRSGECPLFGGIICATGKMQIVKLRVNLEKESSLFSLEKLESISLSAWLSHSDQQWVQFSEIYEIVDYENDLLIGSGETARNGSHGFVSRSQKNNGRLSWLVFFPNSNPFIKCEVRGDKVLAYSSSGLAIEIPLQNPFDVAIAERRKP